jgi:RHS repeat-associated protein
VARYEYDASSNRTLDEDVTRGLATTTEYDFLNRPLSRTVAGTGPNGFTYETLFEYDDPAHTLVETDPRGFRKTTALDGFDRVHRVLQETGDEVLETTSFYDANGNVKTTRDAEGRETSFVYDEKNRLTEVHHPLGLTSSMSYDGEGNKIEEVNRRGLPTRFAYDPLGRRIRTEIDQPVTGEGTLVISEVTYLDPERRRVERDARGNPTTFEMDPRGRVTKVTDPDGFFQTFEYDGVNKVAEVDKKNRRTAFEYDAINRLTKVTDPLLQTMTTTYLDSTRQVVERDKRNLEKTTELDALGRLVSVTRSGVVLEGHEYDGNGNRVRSTDANGNPTGFEYDGANRLVRRIDADQTETAFRYDRVGNLAEQKDARVTGKPFDVKNTYDDVNRLVATEDAEGNVTAYEYDGEGNRTAVVEPRGPEYRTEYSYGELNELLEVRMPDGGVYSYQYDPNRNRIEQKDGEGNVVAFTYDRLNRLDLMVQDPGGFGYSTDHDYDPNGNEIRLTDPKGQVIDREHDELNRLKSKVYNLTPADLALYTRTHRIDYGYDENDNLIRIDETKSSGTDPPAVVSSFKTYDELDRLSSETDAWGRTLTYDYDPQGNRTLLIDPDSVRTEYAYDELNRLETLTFGDGSAVSYEYFPDGLKKKVTNPNGTVSTYLYDAADRMTDIAHLGPTGTVSAYEYTYDANSNRQRQVETNAGRTETTDYTYDRVNRLESVSYPNQSVTYEYDLAGNRVREVTTGANASDKTFEYDAINRLERITDTTTSAVLTAYEYDANGNTTAKTSADTTTTFHFDIRDQLGEVRQGPSILGRYGYDFDGRRILKIGDAGRRQYTYDQLSVVTEADPANATVSKYDYGMDQLVQLDNRTEGRSFFHLDFLGSTVGLTDVVGASRQSIFYDAWGNERDRIGSSANNFTFTGHELDEETGLIYAKARFYDAEVGRFLSQDSFLGEANEPPSLHRYFYAHASPLNFVDPTGNQSEETDWEELQRVSDQYFREGPAKIDIKTPDEYEEPVDSKLYRKAKFWLGATWFVMTETAAHTGRAIGQEVQGALDELWGVHEERDFSGVELENRIAIEQSTEKQPEYLREDTLRSVRLSDQTTGQRVSGEFSEVAGKGAEVTTREVLLAVELEGVAKAATVLPGLTRSARIAEEAEVARLGERRLPQGTNPWIKYQRHVTGQPFEEVWALNTRKIGVDASRAGYTVEAKWTGRNNAAWRSSPYNPASEFYDEAAILDQAENLLRVNKGSGGRGVRYAVSNEAARVHFENLFRAHLPGENIQVWHVPGTGMK